jgi:hypothetical protein
MQKVQGSSSPPQSGSAIQSPQIPPASVSTSSGFSPNTVAYNMPQLSPMMQIQMGIGMNVGLGGATQYGTGGQQGLHPQTQAMHQSVMRHPSPGPQQQGQVPGQGAYGGF